MQLFSFIIASRYVPAENEFRTQTGKRTGDTACGQEYRIEWQYSRRAHNSHSDYYLTCVVEHGSDDAAKPDVTHWYDAPEKKHTCQAGHSTCKAV